MILVVDTSVALKWFVNEEGSAEAVALAAGASQLIAPDLIIPEFANVTWNMVRRGDMRERQQQEAITELPRIFNEIVPTRRLAPRSAALARALDHPAYDCFYLALAEDRDAVMVTADQRFARRVIGTIWSGIVTTLFLSETP